MPTTNTPSATPLFFVFMRENEMIIECCHDSFAKTNIIHVFIIEQTCDLELFPLVLSMLLLFCWKANINFRQKMQVYLIAII